MAKSLIQPSSIEEVTLDFWVAVKHWRETHSQISFHVLQVLRTKSWTPQPIKDRIASVIELKHEQAS